MKLPFLKTGNTTLSQTADYEIGAVWRFFGGVVASPLVPAIIVAVVFSALEFIATDQAPTDITGMLLQAYLGLFMVNIILCLPAMVILSRFTEKMYWFILTGAGCLIVFSILAWGFLGAPISMPSVILSALLGAVMIIVLKRVSGF